MLSSTSFLAYEMSSSRSYSSRSSSSSNSSSSSSRYWRKQSRNDHKTRKFKVNVNNQPNEWFTSTHNTPNVGVFAYELVGRELD
eukprot:3836341-Prymnesium_polylepis.1